MESSDQTTATRKQTKVRSSPPAWLSGVLFCTLGLMSLLPSTASFVLKQQDVAARRRFTVDSSFNDILKAREDIWLGIRPLLAVRLAMLALVMSLPCVAVACIIRRPWVIALTFASLLAAVAAIAFNSMAL